MFKKLIPIAFAATLAVSMSMADQPTGNVKVPVHKTAATDGAQMYLGYCAPCHGADGRGHGPVAASLKSQPTDLTMLTKNNHGKFPGSHVSTVLQFGSELPSHGSAEMPVWGPILGKMNVANPMDKQLRIANLSRYLETLQVK
jgi:mono/diheme cytochrome c family protein